MKNNNYGRHSNIKYIAAAVSALILTAITVTISMPYIVSAAGAGTADDPLVSYSYLTTVFKEELKTEVLTELKKEYKDQVWTELFADVKKEALAELASGGVTADGALGEYTVERLTKGQTLTASSACELILRSGNASAFVTNEANISSGVGLSDCTEGSEIVNGSAIPQRHLLIIPRADGRGVNVTSDEAYFMVRGEYEIK